MYIGTIDEISSEVEISARGMIIAFGLLERIGKVPCIYFGHSRREKDSCNKVFVVNHQSSQQYQSEKKALFFTPSASHKVLSSSESAVDHRFFSLHRVSSARAYSIPSEIRSSSNTNCNETTLLTLQDLTPGSDTALALAGVVEYSPELLHLQEAWNPKCCPGSCRAS